MMNTKSKNIGYFYEKFKAFLLVFLMILCIVQIGILWSSQSGSFPISLFSNSKSSTPTSIEDSKSDYLLPYRVMLSTGFDKDHYVIPNGSNEYNTLWEGAKQYIEQALVNKPKQIQPFTEDAWGTLAANKPYTFEFKTQIPIEIVKWVLELDPKKSVGEGLTSIYKLVICPEDSDNNYSDTLYIRDDKNIYTYDLKKFTGNALNKDEFNEIYTRLKANTDVKNYQMAIERLRKQPISLDLLGIFSSNNKESYPNITCQPVEGLAEKEYTYDNFNNMAKELFGNARNEYDFDMDVNGSVVFKKADGVYRLYKNSILEYRYTGNQVNQEKLSILEAYKKATSFLLEHRSQSNIMTGVSVYLNSIGSDKEKQGSYIFNFDYSISLGKGKGEIPIVLTNYQIPNSSNQLDNSVSIEASSKNVVRFVWLALKFNVNKSLEYEWNFGDMYNKTRNTYAELKREEISIKDFGVYYVLNYPKTYEHLTTPSFVLFTKDRRYDVLMEGNNK
jgi:hypothetical protein